MPPTAGVKVCSTPVDAVSELGPAVPAGQKFESTGYLKPELSRRHANGLPSPSPSVSSEDGAEHGPPNGPILQPSPTEKPSGPETSDPRSHAYSPIRTWGHDWETRRFPRLSKPVEVMRHSYDVVVIGSGYGGGVAASRMARAGQHVCVLERGKERWPGEYPVSSTDALEQLHVSGQFAPKFLPSISVDTGDPTGMYHLILGRGQNAVVGNGEADPMIDWPLWY